MRRLRLVAGLLVSVLVLLFVLHRVDLRETVRAFLSADYPYLVLAALCFVSVFFLTAVRWHYILLPLQSIELRLLFQTLTVGFFSNYLLPAKAGELVRVFMLGRHTGLSGSAILATIVLERAMDMFVLIVALLGVLLLVPLPAWMGYVGQLAGMILLGVVAALVLLLRYPQWVTGAATRVLNPVSARLASSIGARLQAFVTGLEVLRRGGNLGGALLFSLLSWCAAAATQYLAGLALGIRASWMAWVLMLALLNLITIIPSMPGRVGTWELVSVAALGLFAVDSAPAVAFPTLLRIAHLLPLALGYLYFSREGLHLLDLYQSGAPATLPRGRNS